MGKSNVASLGLYVGLSVRFATGVWNLVPRRDATTNLDAEVNHNIAQGPESENGRNARQL